MTRKEMIAACIDVQISKGIVKPENRELQIKARLKGLGAVRPMSWTECKSLYDSYFGA